MQRSKYKTDKFYSFCPAQYIQKSTKMCFMQAETDK